MCFHCALHDYATAQPRLHQMAKGGAVEVRRWPGTVTQVETHIHISTGQQPCQEHALSPLHHLSKCSVG
ncbi:hypothetical protein AMELA_G00048910 [Ameiurus melas]|uniref:Uncharacterized protein n=1 Tax=Ameiurus melas TaxID=219545 RepID=A0A7J6B593_AMEME|nr:hypothetical protein AMELA_G00048910 [Ameiurus melas]